MLRTSSVKERLQKKIFWYSLHTQATSETFSTAAIPTKANIVIISLAVALKG